METNNKDLKVSFIFGETPVDKVDRNGYIDNIFMEDDDYHIEYLLEYFKTHFTDDDYLQSLDISATANAIALYLKDQGHITFFNTTTYKNGKPNTSGKCGLILLPEMLTDKQFESLNEFKQYISDYNDIQVWSDFYYDQDGIINCKTQSSVNVATSVSEFIDIIIEQRKSDTKKK